MFTQTDLVKIRHLCQNDPVPQTAVASLARELDCSPQILVGWVRNNRSRIDGTDNVPITQPAPLGTTPASHIHEHTDRVPRIMTPSPSTSLEFSMPSGPLANQKTIPQVVNNQASARIELTTLDESILFRAKAAGITCKQTKECSRFTARDYAIHPLQKKSQNGY